MNGAVPDAGDLEVLGALEELREERFERGFVGRGAGGGSVAVEGRLRATFLTQALDLQGDGAVSGLVVDHIGLDRGASTVDDQNIHRD